MDCDERAGTRKGKEAGIVKEKNGAGRKCRKIKECGGAVKGEVREHCPGK